MDRLIILFTLYRSALKKQHKACEWDGKYIELLIETSSEQECEK